MLPLFEMHSHKKMSKKFVACTSSHLPRKMTFYATHVIMTKFGIIISLAKRLFFYLFHRTLKMFIFHENLLVHIRFGNIALNTFPKLLNILNFVFSKGSICCPNETCISGKILPLKTMPFIYSQTDHMTAITPILIENSNLLSIPLPCNHNHLQHYVTDTS
jgi:hypothetical protein